MKNYWIDRIKEREQRELIVAARWTPPTDDECGWVPIRPLVACAEQLPGAEPLYVSTPPLPEEQKNVFFVNVPPCKAETFMANLKEQFRKKKAAKGETASEKRWQRTEIMSQMGTSLIFKDDKAPCGDWAKATEPFNFGHGEKGTYSLKEDVSLTTDEKLAKLEALKLEILARNPCGMMVPVPDYTITPPVDSYTITLSDHLLDRNDDIPSEITPNLNSFQWEL